MTGKQPPDVAELKEAAVRSLVRREHSVHEIHGRLLKRGGDEGSIATVIAELLEEGLLSDGRFVEQFCRSRVGRGYGPARILHDLRQHRVDEELIQAAMALYEEEWLQLLETVRQRRFGDTRPKSYQQWAKQARFLQQRGFNAEQINQVLQKAY